MLKISIILLIVLSTLFTSCKSDNIQNEKIKTDTTKQEIKQPTNPNNPASVQINRSNVIIEVLGMGKNDDGTFSLKGKVIEIFEDEAYPSIAVKGETYVLKPNIRVNEDMKVIDSEVNSNLRELSNLEEGKKFQAYITLDNKEWLIQEVIK